MTVQMLGSDGYASDELPKLGGAAVEGMLVSTFFDYTKNDPAVQKFVAAYKAANNGANPDWFAANSYDVIMLAAKAAKNAGKNDRTAINDALGKIGTYQGIAGPITFDANGDVIKPLQIVVVKNGHLVTAPQQPAPVSDPLAGAGEGRGHRAARPSPRLLTGPTPQTQRTS